jgi:predicted ATPase
VAIAGENGSGKSTVLKAAAAAYINAAEGQAQFTRTFNPEDFFPKTPWEAVEGVRLTYTVRQGDSTTNYVLRKPSTRWRGMPERAGRSVFFLDISRTQPIDTLIGYGKIAKAVAFGDQEVELREPERLRLSRVLKRDYTDSRMVVSDEGTKSKQVGVLSLEGLTYSNFHQGAGEDSTADLIALLQEAPNHSLVIIDEVEASLHPRAQRRLVSELFELARTKRLQFILSTHSPFVLERLPEFARVYLQTRADGGRDPLYGVSHEYALTMMDDEFHPDLVVYAEDERASYLGRTILALYDDELVRRIQFVAAGASNVVKILGQLAETGRLPGLSTGLLDGDEVALGADPPPGCLVLPGSEMPERVVFNAVVASGRWQDLALRLGVDEGLLTQAVEDAMNQQDAHDWPGHVSSTLRGPLTERRVWEELCDFYASALLTVDERREFGEPFEDLIG